MTNYFERALIESSIASLEEASRFKSLGKAFTYNEPSETFEEDGKTYKFVVYGLDGEYYIERSEEV